MKKLKGTWRSKRLGVSAGLVGVCIAGTASSVVDVPLRRDIVVSRFTSSSSATSTITYDGNVGEPISRTPTHFLVELSAKDIDCRPGNGRSCYYNINKFEMRLPNFTTHNNTEIQQLSLKLREPVRNIADSGSGIVVPRSAIFDVLARARGKFYRLALRADQDTNSTDDLRIIVNHDAQLLTVEHILSGSGVDPVSNKAVELEVDLLMNSSGPWDNLPPQANAGPDQSHQTSCFAEVSLQPQSTDPNGNLLTQFYREQDHVFGTRGTTNMLPGRHVLELEAADSFGSVDTDTMTVTVTDNGEPFVPPGASLLEVPLPSGHELSEFALVANGDLKVSDRVRISGSNGQRTKVANLRALDSSVHSFFHADSWTDAEVWSRPKAWLLERSRILGVLRTSVAPETQNLPNPPVIQQPFAFGALESYQAVIPPSGPVVHLPEVNVGQTHRHDPGDYGFMSVKSNGTLELTSGTYRFSELRMEPQSVLRVVGSAPAVVIVSQGATMRGSVVAVNPGGGVLLVHTGTSEVILTSPFVGAVLAPQAKLTLNSSNQTVHRGAFYAKDIQIDSDSIVQHDASALVALTTERSACAVVPKLLCVKTRDGNRYARFSYENQIFYQGVRVEHGFANQLVADDPTQRQPTVFKARKIDPGYFEVPFGAGTSVTWTLGARRVVATTASPSCN